MGVPPDNQAGNYLGTPIATTRGSYDFLIEKFENRLQIWKSKTLSQAGRVVLIKSVLQSIPIYFMGTIKVPNSVIKGVNGSDPDFFWGAMDKKRFMCYVSWEKITQPLNQGGLAIRDFTSVNEALLMKALWQVANGSDAVWVQIVMAKYLPCSELWSSKRTYKCSALWKGIMSLRGQLKPLLAWQIGTGEHCKVLSDPWTPADVVPITTEPRLKDMRVRELVDPQTGIWDTSLLLELFGYQGCLKIVAEVQPPRQGVGGRSADIQSSS